MKQILEAVMAKLNEQVTDLRYIAEDYGQMDYYAENPPVKFPAALISISQVQYETLSKTAMRANVSVTVRVADAPSLIGNMAAPQSYRDRAFSILDLIEDVKSAIHGLESNAFRRMYVESIAHATREDLIREYDITFSTGYIDEI